MNRIKRAWLALTGRLEPEPAANAQPLDSEGVLYGLSPPEGHHFDVRFVAGTPHQGWIVSIEADKSGREASYGVAALCGDSHELAIKRAARKALDAYATKLEVQSIEGCYPPKTTQPA
jgi:hypothetical protein